MRAAGYACDVCSRFHEGEALPPGWFSVTRQGGKLELDPIEACSPQCLARLGKQLVQLDGGHTCPECGKAVKTAAGLSTHVGRMHKKPARKAPARLTRKTKKAPAGARRRRPA